MENRGRCYNRGLLSRGWRWDHRRHYRRPTLRFDLYIPLPHVIQTLRLVFDARSLFSGCLFLLFLTARFRLNFLDLLRGVARKLEDKRLLVPADHNPAVHIPNCPRDPTRLVKRPILINLTRTSRNWRLWTRIWDSLLIIPQRTEFYYIWYCGSLTGTWIRPAQNIFLSAIGNSWNIWICLDFELFHLKGIAKSCPCLQGCGWSQYQSRKTAGCGDQCRFIQFPGYWFAAEPNILIQDFRFNQKRFWSYNQI